MGLGVSEPEAVGRPRSIGDEAVVAGVHEEGLFVLDADVPQLIRFVEIEEFLTVRRPDRAVTVDAAICSDARFVAAHLGPRVEFVLAGFVGVTTRD
jgi:hypothetical protein